MVSVKKIDTIFAIIFGEKPEHIAVYVYDLLHGTVFPEIIAIPKLNIGVAVVVVVLQSRKIKVLILQKIVAVAAISAMAVADQDITGRIVK